MKGGDMRVSPVDSRELDANFDIEWRTYGPAWCCTAAQDLRPAIRGTLTTYKRWRRSSDGSRTRPAREPLCGMSGCSSAQPEASLAAREDGGPYPFRSSGPPPCARPRRLRTPQVQDGQAARLRGVETEQTLRPATWCPPPDDGTRPRLPIPPPSGTLWRRHWGV